MGILIQRLSTEWPDSDITVFITLCQYATEQEKEVCQRIDDITFVFSPKDTIRELFFSNRVFSRVFFMGEDPMYATRLSKVTNSRLIGYTERNIKSHSFDQLINKEDGCDLMASGITLQPLNVRSGRVLLPVSRQEYLDVALPFMLDTAFNLQSSEQIHVMLPPPFISDQQLAELNLRYPAGSIARLNFVNDLF